MANFLMFGVFYSSSICSSNVSICRGDYCNIQDVSIKQNQYIYFLIISVLPYLHAAIKESSSGCSLRNLSFWLLNSALPSLLGLTEQFFSYYCVYHGITMWAHARGNGNVQYNVIHYNNNNNTNHCKKNTIDFILFFWNVVLIVLDYIRLYVVK